MSVEFFDVLVRYEVALWSAVDRELGRQGKVSLGQLRALRVVARYDRLTAASRRLQARLADLGPGAAA